MFKNDLVKRAATFGIAAALALAAVPVSAQGMMGQPYQGAATATTDDVQTKQDEAAGKAVLDRLQSGQTKCPDLKDDDFDVLGDYFMGLMSGNGHAAMNQSMQARLGDAGERQMHITLGKRLSGCNTAAAYPGSGEGYFQMMNGNSGWSMMGPAMMTGYGYGSTTFMAGHWVTMGLVWILLALAILSLAKWLLKRDR